MTQAVVASGRRRSWRRIFAWIGGGFLALLLIVAAAFILSPRPGVMLIRAVFRDNDKAITEALAKHEPDDVTTFANESYRDNDKDARLDVHVPDAAVANGEQLPTVVWTHGGAWVAGSKDEWAPYFMVLASRGYTVVGVNYSLGPTKTYPTALHQLNDALAYLQANAERLHIDPENIVLAGDSAGAQITSQFAAMVTGEAYAAQVGIEPSITQDQLRGVILYCGIYDFVPYFGASGIVGWGTRVSTWAYTGDRATTFEDNPALAEMSSINHLTDQYPPVFISGGNDDPLTPEQSMALAAALQKLGVQTTTLFYPDDYEPGLGHEYQFNLDTQEGQAALEHSIRFLESRFGSVRD